MFQEEVVDNLARRSEVFAFEPRADIVREFQCGFFAQDLLNVLPGVSVSGIDHRKPKTGAEPGFGVRCGDELGEFHHVAHGTAVRSAGEKHHVGS